MEYMITEFASRLSDFATSSPFFPTVMCKALPISTTVLLFLLIFWVYKLGANSIYLVDFVCFSPTSRYRCPFSTFLEHSFLMGIFNEKSLQFQQFILERSGLGETTNLPIGLSYLPPRWTMPFACEEAEMVVFSAVEKLLAHSGIAARDISILVVNCSLFTPVPSLSAMIINKFKLRSDVKSFNLSGMGCSAGVISLSLAQNLLRVHGNSYALIVSTENITQNWYCGNRRSMMIPNCLFRIGSAAILLSNKRQDAARSKYKLQHIVRTLTGADDKSFKCVYQEQDEEGNCGVSLSRDLTKVAGEALKVNITNLGPLVLPLSEQIAYVFAEIRRRIQANPKSKAYIPDFKKAFNHFCIHAGGRAVIDELEKSLKLQPDHVEASRMTLHKFANTSSSSIWYELAYLEAKGRIKPGHKVWQIAFGSGFKCNSAVWQALPSITTACKKGAHNNPWVEYLTQYPIHLPDVAN
ncbi:hypothetical protein GOP47_0023115 [Adiantum capillus-veneris]|uniref:3-ketoacyl-CoA synthase n=1 Tax=Adiantum capillus-veneris TaxID=13818 RepID=A0A9D4Z7J3_ADICA|nr:hypothetical protein GOP47_0023115 [Adiantum capillus-veneris]